MSDRRVHRCLLSWSLIVGLVAPTAYGQGNDLSAPTGGRSALMGNTGVALSRDGAAPFLNPATIVRIEDQRLAFSVNFYSLGVTHFSNWHQPGPVDSAHYGGGNLSDVGLSSTSFRVLPSTLCLFFTLGDLANLVVEEGEKPAEKNGATSSRSELVPRKKLAICFATVESEDVGLQAVHYQGVTPLGTTSHVQSLARRWSRTNIGPTYSAYIAPDTAVGASLQGVYSYNSFGINGSSLISRVGGGAIDSNLGTSGNGHSFELTAIFGATYHHNNFTLGASAQAPSLHILGSYDGTYNRSNGGGAAGDVALVTSGSGSYHTTPPLRFSMGAGMEWNKFALEVDAAIDVPTASAMSASVDTTANSLTKTGITQTRSTENYAVLSHTTINPGLGGEYFVKPSFSLLGGVSANLTALSPLQPAPSLGNLVQARMSHATASFGIGSYGEGGELLFGGQFDYGWGQALVMNPYVVPNDWAVVGAQSYNVMLIIAGATDLRILKRAAERVKNVVTTGNPDAHSPTK